MWPLSGKVVLLTGASRGLGVDMAKALAQTGARLALAARSEAELKSVADEVRGLGAEAIAVPADVASPESLEQLVARVTSELGSIDVLINNAGVEKPYEFERYTLGDIDWILNVNVHGLMHLTRIVIPQMIERRSGHIVNIASMAGLMGIPHNSIYSASKHAVVGFSRSLRLEMKDDNIGVSVVCPGFVEGGMFLEVGRKPPPLAGWVSSKKVADAVVKAIRTDAPEINVNKGLGKIGDWFMAISPRLTGWSMNVTGVVPFYREVAATAVSEAEDSEPPRR